MQENFNISNRRTTIAEHGIALFNLSEQQEKPITVKCDICGDKAEALFITLERQGWDMQEDFAFCPSHEEI